MKFFPIALALFSSTALFATPKHGDVPRHFVFEADWVYYQLSKVSSKCLTEIGEVSPQLTTVKSCSADTGKCLISINSIVDKFIFDSGLRLVAQYLPSLDWIFEGRFTGCLHWNAAQGASCSQTLAFPFAVNNTSDFIYADNAHVRYESNLNTGEFNAWYNLTPRRANYFSGSFIFGIRYLQINEKAVATFTNSGRKSDFKSRTSNQMIGPQLGFDLSSFPYWWFNWGIDFKIALVGDSARQHTKLQDWNNTNTLRNFNNSTFMLSWVTELAPVIYLRPSDWFYIRFDYELFYISSVATAPAQFSLHRSGKAIKHNIKHRYQGLSLGAGIEF